MTTSGSNYGSHRAAASDTSFSFIRDSEHRPDAAWRMQQKNISFQALVMSHPELISDPSLVVSFNNSLGVEKPNALSVFFQGFDGF